VKQIRRRREKQICKTENKLESTVLLRLCCFTGHGAAAGAERKRRRKPFRISPAACVFTAARGKGRGGGSRFGSPLLPAFSRRRVNPRAASDVARGEDAPPLFQVSLASQKRSQQFQDFF